MRKGGLILTGAGIAGLLSLSGGCKNGVYFQEQVVRTDDMLAVPGPFRPAAMRVHPLTHTELGTKGTPELILHVELKDPWGDTVKGVGQMQVQLRRGASGTTIGDPGTRWDIDLRDIEENISYFDSATRTYRVVLGGLPGWLAQAVQNGQETDARLRVLFRTSKADGEAVVLQDEYLMR